ncbi:hypothetical protein M513_04469, partial [Trichuris suis]
MPVDFCLLTGQTFACPCGAVLFNRGPYKTLSEQATSRSRPWMRKAVEMVENNFPEFLREERPDLLRRDVAVDKNVIVSHWQLFQVEGRIGV